jgi:DNA-binding transcriptional ArsR family regulator
VQEHRPPEIHWSWSAVISDPVRLSILRALCELGTATMAELLPGCHTSERTVRRHLDALAALGLVSEEPGERDGLTPGRPAGRFILDGEVARRARPLFRLLSQPLAPWLPAGPEPPHSDEPS